MEKVLTILLFVLLCSVVHAQVGIGTQTPDVSSELEVVSSDKGILIPRLSSQDLVSGPAEGLLIYNTTEGKFYYYDGSNWQELSPWDYRQGSNAADEEDLVVSFTNAATNTGIASSNPQSKLSVGGNAAIGSAYAGSNAAPNDGLLVEGNVGLGTTNPGTHKLAVNGTSDFTGDMTITGEVAATRGTVPIGSIMMWSGSPSSLPPGWVLCNGSGNYLDFQGVTRNVPDLRGRFIVGYDPGNGAYNAIGDQGGAATVTLSVSQIPSHNHGGATSTDGNHTHTVTDQYRPTTLVNGTDFNRQGVENNLTSVTRTTSTNGNHSHTISSQGGGGSHENRPPYYTLAYIIRVN